jgi:hypothetical protein
LFWSLSFPPYFFFHSVQTKQKKQFLQMAALIHKYIKRFPVTQAAERSTEVNFSISHHKNSILLILQKHFTSFTRLCSLFLFFGSFVSTVNIQTFCQRYRKENACQ